MASRLGEDQFGTSVRCAARRLSGLRSVHMRSMRSRQSDFGAGSPTVVEQRSAPEHQSVSPQRPHLFAVSSPHRATCLS
jgi:hypothetical protein